MANYKWYGCYFLCLRERSLSLFSILCFFHSAKMQRWRRRQRRQRRQRFICSYVAVFVIINRIKEKEQIKNKSIFWSSISLRWFNNFSLSLSLYLFLPLLLSLSPHYYFIYAVTNKIGQYMLVPSARTLTILGPTLKHFLSLVFLKLIWENWKLSELSKKLFANILNFGWQIWCFPILTDFISRGVCA